MKFIDEWRNNENWWFGGTKYDEFIIESFEHLLNNNINFECPLESIIIYDQLPRHIFRNMQCHHIIEFFLRKAIKLTNISQLWNKTEDPFVITFSLLPYRHSNIPELVFEAIDIAWSKKCFRFLKASYERCPMIPPILVNFDENCEIDKSILAFFPKENIDLSLGGLLETKRKCVISLSGGVDSMVASFMLRNNISAAIHINYCNRSTSYLEANFVKWWCKLLKVPLYIRNISEINRCKCMEYGLRETYESYTKNVRFNAYKFVLRSYGAHSIVLGHNKCDILENIFTNISKNAFDDLNGMCEDSIISDIPFWRPLLGKTKYEIIEFAHQYNIPYLPNSTPLWSQRGQIRNTIVPTLDIWNHSFCSSLFNLSDDLKDLYMITFDNIKKIVKMNDNIIELNLDTFQNNRIYWKILFKLFNISASSKSIENLITRIKNKKIGCMLYVLSKSHIVKINGSQCSISKSS